MIVHLVTVDWHYEVEHHGIFSAKDLAEDYIDSMVGQPAGEAYRIADGSTFQPRYKRENFDIQDFVLDGGELSEEDKPAKCGNTYTTADKNITFTCSRDKDHEGYHTQNGGVWGFELPKLTKKGCF